MSIVSTPNTQNSTSIREMKLFKHTPCRVHETYPDYARLLEQGLQILKNVDLSQVILADNDGIGEYFDGGFDNGEPIEKIPVPKIINIECDSEILTQRSRVAK